MIKGIVILTTVELKKSKSKLFKKWIMNNNLNLVQFTQYNEIKNKFKK